MTTGSLALIILGAILVQVAVAALRGAARRRREFAQRLAAGETPPAAVPRTVSQPTAGTAPDGPAWEGFREFVVERREFEDTQRSVCSFHLVPADGRPLPAFRPGQYLTFKLEVADPVTGEPKAVVRCYSLSDAPRPDHYRISIKRVPAPAGRPELPPGVGSNHFHDHVQAGSRLLVKAPGGHFHLAEADPLPIVLIGGGIGITPMLSILTAVLEGGSGREVWLYYGVRNGSEQVMKAPLQALARAHPNFHLHVCYSAPGPQEVEGTDYQHPGRVDIPLLRNTLQLRRHQFYVCGPAAFMESLVPGLEAWGVDSGDIFYEAFGPSALKRTAAPPASVASGTVTFRRSGKRLAWHGDAGSLLDLAEANGIAVESGCRAGSCGGCQTTVVAGEVDYRHDPDATVEPGHCLLCIATPRGDLVLDA